MSTPSPQDGFGTTPGALRDDAADTEPLTSVSSVSPELPGMGAAPLTPAGSDIEGDVGIDAESDVEKNSEPIEGIARTRHDTSYAGSDDDAVSGSAAEGVGSAATARTTLSDTFDRIAGFVDSTMQHSDEWMQSARDEVRAHPMAAVAAAFVAGIVFDRMRRPGSSREA